MKNKVRPIDANALTLEQLREMGGKPAFSPEINCCVLITKNPFTTLLTFMDGEQCSASDWYEEVGPVYSYHPSHIDREAWEPCEWCGSVGGKPDNWVCSLEDDNGYTVTNNHMVVCATANYCPVCGRPLTPEAWAELEKRLRG